MNTRDLQNEIKLRKERDIKNCVELAKAYTDTCLDIIKTKFSRQFVTSKMLGFEITTLNIDKSIIEVGVDWAIPNFKSIEDYNFIPFCEAVQDLCNEIYGELTFTFSPFVDELESLGFQVYVNTENGNLIPFFKP